MTELTKLIPSTQMNTPKFFYNIFSKFEAENAL